MIFKHLLYKKFYNFFKAIVLDVINELALERNKRIFDDLDDAISNR